MTNKKIFKTLQKIEKRARKHRPSPLRYGQAVYIYTYDAFPEAVLSLKNTQYDCFDNDSVVFDFLVSICRIVTDGKAQRDL